MTAPAPATLSDPVRAALNAVTVARSELADDTEAQKKLLEAVQADVDAGKLDADSANSLLSAYGAKEFAKAKDEKKPAEHAAPEHAPAEHAAAEDPPKAAAHNKR